MNRLAIRGWRTIRPLSRHGQHVEMVIGGDGASDECLMRRSDTILTASYVDDAMFCTDDSYPRFCRIEIRIEVVHLGDSVKFSNFIVINYIVVNYTKEETI